MKYLHHTAFLLLG